MIDGLNICDGHVPHYGCACVEFDRRGEAAWDKGGSLAYHGDAAIQNMRDAKGYWAAAKVSHIGYNGEGTVRVFRPNFALEDAIESHACSLDANMRVTNGIPLGSPLLLPLYHKLCTSTEGLKEGETLAHPDTCSELGANSNWMEMGSQKAFMPSDQYDGFCFRKDMVKKDPSGQKYKGKCESKCTGEKIKDVPLRTNTYIMQKGVRYFTGLNDRDKPTKIVRGITAAKKLCNEIRDPDQGGLICSGIFQKEKIAGEEEDWENVDWILKLFLQDCASWYGCYIHDGDEIAFFR
jgi:hypothetical protein